MSTKLYLLIFSLLILSTFSKRKLKEENSEEEEHDDDECEGEETCEKEKQEEIDLSKLFPSQIRKENKPDSKVLLPIRRIGTSNAQLGEGPCGGVEKKSANTLTTKGSSVTFIWEVLVPESSGNCTVKISNGLQDEENFILLKPLNEKVNEDGSFKCYYPFVGELTEEEFLEFVNNGVIKTFDNYYFRGKERVSLDDTRKYVVGKHTLEETEDVKHTK